MTTVPTRRRDSVGRPGRSGWRQTTPRQLGLLSNGAFSRRGVSGRQGASAVLSAAVGQGVCAVLRPVGTVVRACESTRVRRRDRLAAGPARGASVSGPSESRLSIGGRQRLRRSQRQQGGRLSTGWPQRTCVRRYMRVRRHQRRSAVDSPSANVDGGATTGASVWMVVSGRQAAFAALCAARSPPGRPCRRRIRSGFRRRVTAQA